jgi:membrane-associated phospholipid phosphatase
VLKLKPEIGVRARLEKLTTSTHARFVTWKLLLVAALALAVAVGEASLLVNLDLAVAKTVHNLTVGWLTELVIGITDLASTPVVLLLTLLASLTMAALRHWRGAIALATSVLATQAVVAIVKVLVNRPRPEADLAITDPSGYSFPSGHSATAVALYVTLALVAASVLRPRWRPAVYAAAGLVALAVGLSRIYLGAHYPTDVLAGWLTGGSLVTISWVLASRLPFPRRPAVAALGAGRARPS